MRKRRWLMSAICGLVLILVGKSFIFTEYKVEGISMQPTLEEGRYLSINRLSHLFVPVKRFDVVVFLAPHTRENYVKRIIGLPGDSLEYKNDQLYVNGVLMNEPFLLQEKDKLPGSRMTGNFSLKDISHHRTIPKGHFFVAGDNRLYSRDSRHFGLVRSEDIVGRVSVK
ncbi:signal peptidase I [Bacillus lacus]|uniref:Signal peptidase I n=1 Tax=Metabacillus lacus TaxID=1983721 RepID=A0A7X2J1G8_9BACI|nr:signal peptidase I [Metabacillus lacus]MRX73529.1 signal peptidase I [Metabacillus lacus]